MIAVLAGWGILTLAIYAVVSACATRDWIARETFLGITLSAAGAMLFIVLLGFYKLIPLAVATLAAAIAITQVACIVMNAARENDDDYYFPEVVLSVIFGGVITGLLLRGLGIL